MDTNFSMVKHCFFDTAIADIFRAIRGGSLMGAFTQSMCAIDAMAYLRNALPGKGSRLNFMKWTEDWIVPLNNNCRPDVLYALRCGLVHTYGYADAMRKCGIQGFSYVHNQSNLHWLQSQPNTYSVNLDSHIAEVTVAAFTFFDNLSSICTKDAVWANDVATRIQNLIYVQGYFQFRVDSTGRTIILPVIRTQSRFANMDAALAPLDEQTQPQVAVIASEIQKMYSTN